MDKKETIIEVLGPLETALRQKRGGTDLTRYVHETLAAVRRGDGVAVTGAFQQFLNGAPAVLLAEAEPLDATEKAAWDKAMAVKQLGNNLWGA